MSVTTWTRGGLALALSATLGILAGCGEPANTGGHVEGTGGPAKVGHHDHSGWWCPEHGIPEEVCSMCSAKAAEECKAKGDWCEKHDRALSQCFICNPERKEHFANLYRAKNGKEPPPIEE